MRIVSQREDISIDFDRSTIRVYEQFIYLTDLGLKQDVMLGAYETIERAKEVFKEIHDRYFEEMLNLPDAEVYYMPKE